MANLGNGRLTMFPPVIKWLLGINIAVFLLEMVTFGGQTRGYYHPFEIIGGLWPVGSEQFRVWQYVTYMFLHGGFTHIFFNMFVLWMFGMELEQMWGSRRFLAYYLICGIGAGIAQSLISLMPDMGGVAVGASGAIMGVMIAYGMIFPDRIIFLFFIPMRARFAVLLLAGFDLVMGLVSPVGDSTAHFAHLGGALVGLILLKIGGKMTLGGIFDRIPGLGERSSRHAVDNRFNTPPSRNDPRVVDVTWRDVPSRTSPPSMDFGDDQEAVDRILDKITHEGYQSLTAEEKEILNRASKRMRG